MNISANFLNHFKGHHTILVSMPEDNSRPPLHHHGGYNNKLDLKLSNLNDAGEHGIFFTVNLLDEKLDEGRHRTGKMVTHARAIFMDDDNPRDEAREDFPIEPSLIVNTSQGKYHYYWLIEGMTDDIETWRCVQNGLINRYDGDRQARDLTRYLRLPGFYHNKKDPYPVTYEGSGAAYSWGELTEEFPPEKNVTKKADGTVSSSEAKPVDGHVTSITDGTDYHGSLISLTHQLKKEGMPNGLIVASLKGIMNGCSDELKSQDRWINRYNDIERDVEQYVPPDTEMKVPVVKRDVMTDGEMPWPPGAFGDLAKSAHDMARFQYREVAVVSALGLVAGICGRKFNAEGAGLNIYATLIMDTGMGKDSINGFITTALMQANDVGTGSSFIGPVRFTGPKAVFNSLEAARSQVCVFTEAGLLLNSKSGDKDGLKRVLLGLYTKSGQNSYSGAEVYSDTDKAVKSLRAPALTIINESTPKMLLDVFRQSDGLTSGDVPRQLIFRVVGDKPAANRRHYTASVTEECSEKLKHLIGKCSAVQAVEDPQAWNLIPDPAVEEDMIQTEAMYVKMQNDNRHENATKYAMATRAYYKAVRLAAIASVFNHYKEEIHMEEWLWAKSMIAHEMSGLAVFFRGGGQTDPVGDVVFRVMIPTISRILNDIITFPSGLSKKDHKAGKFKRYELTQAIKNNIDINGLNENGFKKTSGIDVCVDYLFKEGMIFKVQNTKAIVYQVTDTFLAACDD